LPANDARYDEVSAKPPSRLSAPDFYRIFLYHTIQNLRSRLITISQRPLWTVVEIHSLFEVLGSRIVGRQTPPVSRGVDITHADAVAQFMQGNALQIQLTGCTRSRIL
jgi:hypothetical protein